MCIQYNTICICYCTSGGIITNLFHTWSYTVYTLRMLRSNVSKAMWQPKWSKATMSVKICVINFQKRRLSLAFFEEKTSLFGARMMNNLVLYWKRHWKICPSKGPQCTIKHQRATQCTVLNIKGIYMHSVHSSRVIALAVPLKWKIRYVMIHVLYMCIIHISYTDFVTLLLSSIVYYLFNAHVQYYKYLGMVFSKMAANLKNFKCLYLFSLTV